MKCIFIFYSLKLSTNIFVLKNSPKLAFKEVQEIFTGCAFNLILPPKTQLGYWLLYVSDQKTYDILLQKPFLKS